MSFFGVNVNPFSTPVGQKIEQATDSNLPSENWALNMEICDIINETEDGPRDALKAIKRRLNQAAGKNYTVVLYTLTVLETCVKNCGKRFHSLVCSREFVLELVKMIGPKNEPPTAVQEKVLNLIQTWADTFRNQPYTQGVVQVYQELKAKGMQFPMTDLDAMAPIITPERSVPEMTCPVHTQGNERNIPYESSATAVNHQIQLPSQQQQQQQPVHLSDNLIAKLKNELEIVQGNMRVLAEMLHCFTNPDKTQQKKASIDSTQPDSADLELMQQLYSTCKAMQERVVELIDRFVHDEMTAELLRVNDELNNLFLRYSRYTKNKGVTPASSILAQTIAQPPGSDIDLIKKQSEPSLIDLDEDSVHSIDKQLSNLDISNKGIRASNQSDQPDNDEFDMFAQSRNATYDSTKNTGSKYEDNIEELSGGLNSAILSRGATAAQPSAGSTKNTVPLEESEFNEMAEWLSSTSPKEPGDQESLTSSEFERFLAERAAAAEALPNIPIVTASPNTTTTPSTTGANIKPRQINKDQDQSLFAL